VLIPGRARGSRRNPAEPAGGGEEPRPGRRFSGFAAVAVLAALILAVAAALAGFSAAGATTAPGRSPSAPAPPNCDSGGRVLWGHLAECGWPGVSNTGPDLADCPGHQLALRGNGDSPIYIRDPGTVINCEELRGLVYIYAPDVTITNSVVDAKSGTGASGSAGIRVEPNASATIDHVSVFGAERVHACVWHEGTKLVVHAMNCTDVNDGVFTWSPVSRSASAGDHFTVTGSYFHNFTHATANGHDDGYQTEGGSHGLIRHNTFQMTADSTSALGIWNGRKSATDITVADNLITGGGFSVYAEDYSPGTGAPGEGSAAGGSVVTGINFTGNAFSTFAASCVGKYGVWFTRPTWIPYQGGPTDGWHREGNYVLETGEDIDHSNPHHDGTLCR
jgi:hypothetical protein